MNHNYSMSKRRRLCHKVSDDMKIVIWNVFNFFHKRDLPEKPLERPPSELTAEATGFNYQCVLNVVKDFKKGDQIKDNTSNSSKVSSISTNKFRFRKLDNFDIDSIIRIVYKFFEESIPPTAEMIKSRFLDSIDDNDFTISKTTIRKVLKISGKDNIT